jgi:hypothetical protein
MNSNLWMNLRHNTGLFIQNVWPGLVPVMVDVHPRVRRWYRAIRWKRPGPEFSIRDLDKLSPEQLEEKRKFFANNIREVHNHNNYYHDLNQLLTESARRKKGKLDPALASRFRNLKENWARAKQWEAELIDRYNAVAEKTGNAQKRSTLKPAPNLTQVKTPVQGFGANSSEIIKRTLSAVPEEHMKYISAVREMPDDLKAKFAKDKIAVSRGKTSGILSINSDIAAADPYLLLHHVGKSLASGDEGLRNKFQKYYEQAVATEKGASEVRPGKSGPMKHSMGSVSSSVSNYALSDIKTFVGEHYRAYITMPRDSFKQLTPPGMYDMMRKEMFGGVDGFSIRKNLRKAGVAVINPKEAK